MMSLSKEALLSLERDINDDTCCKIIIDEVLGRYNITSLSILILEDMIE